MRKFLAIFLVFWSGTAFAGTGYYVTFVNRQSVPIELSPGGSDHWYLEDFGDVTVIPAGQTRTLYTESGLVMNGIVGLNISGGAYEGSHLELWKDDAEHSVTQSIREVDFRQNSDQVSVDRFMIGTNNEAIRTAIGLRPDGSYNTIHATVIFP
jgi:hypothetical protein